MKPHPTKDLAYVWAITSKGEALFRLNVNSKNPDGSDWTHVSSDVSFQSITIGGKGTDNSPFKVTFYEIQNLLHLKSYTYIEPICIFLGRSIQVYFFTTMELSASQLS